MYMPLVYLQRNLINTYCSNVGQTEFRGFRKFNLKAASRVRALEAVTRSTIGGMIKMKLLSKTLKEAKKLSSRYFVNLDYETKLVQAFVQRHLDIIYHLPPK